MTGSKIAAGDDDCQTLKNIRLALMSDNTTAELDAEDGDAQKPKKPVRRQKA